MRLVVSNQGAFFMESKGGVDNENTVIRLFYLYNISLHFFSEFGKIGSIDIDY